jgi:alkaline phosphatase
MYYKLAIMKFRAIASLFCTLALLNAPIGLAQSQKQQPENIIILFADGTTSSQYEFGRYSSQLLRQKPFAITDVVMSKGSFQLMKTESANYFITDSAAAASAMSTGQKVNNGAISVTPDGNSPITLMKFAKDNGKRIGLISTAPVYDASPAAFSVHAKSRRDSESIVNQYLQLEPEVIMGGGADFFLPSTVDGGKRSDGKNIIQAFQDRGFQYIDSPDGLNNLSKQKVLGLFADEDIDYEIERNPKEAPSLSQMLDAGLRTFKQNTNPNKGFILFIENENTDSAGHNNDVASLMRDLWAFDDAVKLALDFQKLNPNTLIIVTGDHETGGFAPTYGRKNLGLAGTTNYLNVDIEQLKLIEQFKMSLNEFSTQFKAKIKRGASKSELNAFLNHMLEENFPGLNLDDDLREKIISQDQLYPNSNYLPANILGLAIARQTGFYWGTSGHTPAPITVAAIGPGSNVFKGYDDNTSFATKLRRLISGK